MLKINFFLYVAIVLLIVTCKVSKPISKRTIEGKYVTPWSLLVIKNDSTFQYEWGNCGLFSGKTTGKWAKKDNFLILNSDIQYPDDISEYYRIIDSNKLDNDSFIIDLVDKNLEPLTLEACFFRGEKDTFSQSDFNGRCSIINQNYDTIAFEGIFMDPLYITLKDKEINYYKIQALQNNNLRYYQPFNNEKWKIKEDTLVAPDTKNFIELNRYLKIKRRKKQ